jgi:demethylmenaquinone methyltransferase/2-methoxy-6-polyprenyl-1,4-benzoquinol methylase
MKNVTLLLMDAEQMDFSDNRFDYVVKTFVLCTIPDPVKALREMRRVLKLSGELKLLSICAAMTPLLPSLKN